MALEDTLKQDMKAAMRSRDTVRLGTIRMLLADLKNQTITLGRAPNEGEELALLSKHAKQRREAMEAFDAGGRDDLRDQEAAELAVVSGYLPEQLDAEAVTALIAEIVAEVGATSRREMGKVMGKLMPKIKGKFDGKLAKGLVEAALDAGS